MRWFVTARGSNTGSVAQKLGHSPASGTQNQDPGATPTMREGPAPAGADHLGRKPTLRKIGEGEGEGEDEGAVASGRWVRRR